jgi:integrase
MVRYKKNSKWATRAFRDEQTARAFDAEQSPVDDARMTLGELTVSYMRSNPDMHPTTKKRIVALLSDTGAGAFMRDKYADSLSRIDLERLREGLRVKGDSNNTINKYQAYIRAILAWGADQELIHGNPWRDFKRLKTTRYTMTATLDDLRRVYAELPPHLQWAAKTAFFLALRFGEVELFNLRWDAFDWRRGIVSVRQGKSGRIKTVVPHQGYMREAALRCANDRRQGIAWVCHTGKRKILSYRSAWQSACKRAGVKMRPYDIRHLAATEMLAAGADLSATAAQLGHASVTTTGSTYAHITAGSQAHAASLMPSIDL